VQAGEEITYQLGVGFAVNERVTLSSALQGAFITETKIEGERIEGSILEPIRMRFAATISRNCRIVEPFAEIAMTDDAPSRLGVTWTF
jgi:hypothetical protein